MKPVLWKRGGREEEERRLCCLEEVAARCKYQQRVDWQRVPTTEGSRYEASAGAKEETVFCVSSGGFLKVFH